MVTRPLAKKKIVYFFSFCMDVSASIRLCCDFFVIKSFISLNLRELILNYLNVNSLVKIVQSYPLFKVDSLNIFINYNLGQRVGDKFTKLNEIGFSVECFTVDFLRLFTEKR